MESGHDPQREGISRGGREHRPGEGSAGPAGSQAPGHGAGAGPDQARSRPDAVVPPAA